MLKNLIFNRHTARIAATAALDLALAIALIAYINQQEKKFLASR